MKAPKGSELIAQHTQHSSLPTTPVTCNTMSMTVRDRVSDYRSRMRAQGYRPVQIWVPDVRAPGFAEEARRQADLVASNDRSCDDQDFIQAVSVDWGDE